MPPPPSKLSHKQVVLTSGLVDLKSRALDACDSLVKALASSGASLEAHYLASGRLAHKSRLLESLIYGLLIWRNDPTLKTSATATLTKLACVEARDDAEAERWVKRYDTVLLADPIGSSTPEMDIVQLWLVSWLLAKYAPKLSNMACESYPLDALWESSDISHVIIAQLLELVNEIPVMILLLEKLESLFRPLDMVEMEAGDFWREWALLLSQLSVKLLNGNKVDEEGRLEHAMLCLFRRLCLETKSVKSTEVNEGIWRMTSVSSFVSLCDGYKWKQMRREDAIKCATLLIACLKPEYPVSARVMSCINVGKLLSIGVRGRLKSFHKMVGADTIKRDWLDVSCLVCNPLLNMLGDPVEAVRLEAANALQELLFYMSPTGTFKIAFMSLVEKEKDSIDEGWSRINMSDIGDEIGYDCAVDYISLGCFVKAIAPLLVSENSWDEEEEEDVFLDALDTLMRQAAVIDPSAFTTSLNDFTLSGRLGELDSHAELLLNLETAKTANQSLAPSSLACDLELD
jgi:hypothetical protein